MLSWETEDRVDGPDAKTQVMNCTSANARLAVVERVASKVSSEADTIASPLAAVNRKRAEPG